MSFDIHSLMQDPNHVDRVIRFAIEHDVRTYCVPEISIPNNASPASLFAARQRFHRPDQIAVVVVCLLERPMLDGITPNVFEIEFGQRCQPKLSALTAMRGPHADQEGLAVEWLWLS
ncbi:hypothetical protein J2785_006390 [Burkholderia ambifaria]|nr:hypothetical protein [Burkholderia ambifaria]